MPRAATAGNRVAAPLSLTRTLKTWELGTYPGGTWTALGDINDFGTAVGQGDLPDGSTHTLAVSLFGQHAGEWIDLKTLGGTYSGWEEGLAGISNTGLIVGHSAIEDGHVHGFAWTRKSGMVDLGTLADIGYPEYNSSYAAATNKLGTLIVGWSGIEVSCLDCASALPVVWTRSIVWKNGAPELVWKIHKLDTEGFPDLSRWYVFSVNDFGQIVGIAWNDDETVGIPILWNLSPNLEGWKAMALAASPGYPYALPFRINNRGEITGMALSADGIAWLPRFWKPLDFRRRTYSQPIELALPEGFAYGYTDGINDLGDMTGECWGDAGDQAVRWTTRNPSFVQVIGFPGDWSWSFGVNNNRIAVVTYGGGNCTGDSCGGAVQIR